MDNSDKSNASLSENEFITEPTHSGLRKMKKHPKSNVSSLWHRIRVSLQRDGETFEQGKRK